MKKKMNKIKYVWFGWFYIILLNSSMIYLALTYGLFFLLLFSLNYLLLFDYIFLINPPLKSISDYGTIYFKYRSVDVNTVINTDDKMCLSVYRFNGIFFKMYGWENVSKNVIQRDIESGSFSGTISRINNIKLKYDIKHKQSNSYVYKSMENWNREATDKKEILRNRRINDIL